VNSLDDLVDGLPTAAPSHSLLNTNGGYLHFQDGNETFLVVKGFPFGQINKRCGISVEVKLSERDTGGAVFSVKDKFQFEITRSQLKVSDSSASADNSSGFWGFWGASGYSLYYSLPNEWTRIMVIIDSETEIIFGNEIKVIGETSSFKLPALTKVI
jgi:hypothetical protein